MKKLSFMVTALSLGFATSAFSTDNPVVSGGTVNFAMKADQPTLKDSSKKDSFIVDLNDPKVETNLKLSCTAGTTGWFKSTDESCSVTGSGYVLNGTKLRAQYAGGWTVKPDGFTDAGGLNVNYLPVGSIAGASSAFGGNMKLKPENPSSETELFKQAFLKKIGASAKAGETIDQRIDTVQLSGVTIPSAGMPSDHGCTWTGNMGFSYQTNSWDMALQATCSGKVYVLSGGMPWTDTKGVANQTEYNLTLSLPSASGDQALSVSPDDAGLSATADGISGKIIMKQSNITTVQVDGKDTDVPMNIDASGSLTGQNVPIDTVRSFATLIGVLSRTFFGA